jgi:hypothetical protein
MYAEIWDGKDVGGNATSWNKLVSRVASTVKCDLSIDRGNEMNNHTKAKEME